MPVRNVVGMLVIVAVAQIVIMAVVVIVLIERQRALGAQTEQRTVFRRV